MGTNCSGRRSFVLSGCATPLSAGLLFSISFLDVASSHLSSFIRDADGRKTGNHSIANWATQLGPMGVTWRRSITELDPKLEIPFRSDENPGLFISVWSNELKTVSVTIRTTTRHNNIGNLVFLAPRLSMENHS